MLLQALTWYLSVSKLVPLLGASICKVKFKFQNNNLFLKITFIFPISKHSHVKEKLSDVESFFSHKKGIK
jgi:hypothetical protein